MKKRVFAAIEISDEAKQKAAAYAKNLRERFPSVRAGWDKPKKLHLTMKFLGEIDDKQLKELIGSVEKTARQMSPFKIILTETGVFPSPKQAKVLWLGVRDAQESLRRLNEILENECEKTGFAKEKRNFKPHLTLARFREKSTELVDFHLNQKFEPVEFEVSEIVIFQSELQPTGSIYSVISKHEFK